MLITRLGRSFDVVDDPQTASWRFWQDHFATGEWEAGTLQTISEYLRPGSAYLDIGAWVGPTVLWASQLCRRVVAVEPDPTALEVLTANVQNNCQNVTIIAKAVAATNGKAELGTQGEWGDSMSTLLPTDGESVTVETVELGPLLTDDLDLVKIDIEGGEAAVFPLAADRLHELGCPVLLGLHLPWIDDPRELLAAVNTFDVLALDPHPHFPTLLLR